MQEEIGYLIVDRSDLHLSPLPRWSSGFFCGPEHPLAERAVVPRDELLSHRIGSVELSPWAMADLCEYFEQSIASAISFRSDDCRDIEAAAVGGRMVVFGNRPVFRSAIQRGALVEVPLQPPPLQRAARLGSVTPAARRLSPAVSRAKAIADSIFADYATTASDAKIDWQP